MLPCLEKLIYYEDITKTSPIYQKMELIIGTIDDLLSKHHNKDINNLLIKIKIGVEGVIAIVNSYEYINRQQIEAENRQKILTRKENAKVIANYILFIVKDIKLVVKLKDDYFTNAIIDSSQDIIKKLCDEYLKSSNTDREYYKLLFVYLSSNPLFDMANQYEYIESKFKEYLKNKFNTTSKEEIDELSDLLKFISKTNTKEKYGITPPIKDATININYNQELLDLRDKYTFTIDSKNSECLDDAISFETLSNDNFVISIYITDLSSVILPDDKLDRYAYNLAETIYHTSVIPMLPANIHNDYCSLVTVRDKIVHAYSFEINPDFIIISADIKKAIIRVRENYTYDQIDNLILNSDILFADELRKLYEYSLYLIRNNVRRQLYIENKEIIDPTRKYNDRFGNNPSNRIISELKVLVNSYLALNAYNMYIPFIYRNNLYSRFTLDESIKEVLKDKEFTRMKSLLYSSFGSSFYSNNNLGHYGLDVGAYAHVTTPLRNYSSLFNQRMVSSYMINEKVPADESTLKIISKDLAKHLNQRIVLNKIYCAEVSNKRKTLTK